LPEAEYNFSDNNEFPFRNLIRRKGDDAIALKLNLTFFISKLMVMFTGRIRLYFGISFTSLPFEICFPFTFVPIILFICFVAWVKRVNAFFLLFKNCLESVSFSINLVKTCLNPQMNAITRKKAITFLEKSF